MELLDLIREAEELDKDIKERRREFNLKIKEEVKTHKSKKRAIQKILKEAIESREYEYREIKVKSCSAFGESNIKTHYPFLKLEDVYEIKKETFMNQEDGDYEGLTRKYVLYNKNNGLEFKVIENTTIREYEKGTNERYKYIYSFGEKTITASKSIWYTIEIGKMKFEFLRSFDVSKI